MKRTFSLLLLLQAVIYVVPIHLPAQIFLNQVGMYPTQEKTAVVEGRVRANQVSIVSDATGCRAVRASVLRTAVSPWSKKERTVVEFSSLREPGSYTIRCGRHTARFTIAADALHSVTAATLKAFYLIRSGMPIERRYAGHYARPTGHPDTLVFIHPSAASPGRPAGSVISSPGGWYDAGDYNKYVVNSAFSVGILLCCYEQNRDYFERLCVDIPESDNQTADVLDELYYNLAWMLTMQDPYDGGVYHKLTTPSFEAFILPTACRQKRYVVKKTTTATLDFAAVMAQAARLFKGNADYPDFAGQAARAALAAYGWAERNSTQFYRQEQMNRQYRPAVNTGAYDDSNSSDELYWAATELYFLTADPHFAEVAAHHQPHRFMAPTWNDVASLGTFEWLSHPSTLTPALNAQLLAYCDSLVTTTASSSFQTSCGNRARDFGWGCLAQTFGTSGVALLYAHRLTGKAQYLTAALQNADYVLGRNATGYCYITGFGEYSPLHPHHRISAADDIEPPFPGLLVGGPNPAQQDKAERGAHYPSSQPDESYTDETSSYASNEIAINWNASILALLAWLDALL